MKQKTCLVGPAQAQAIFAFEGVGGIAACEPNVNALCELKLRVQLKEKEKVYAASQMEDGSIKELSSEDFKPLSDFLRTILRLRYLNAKYPNMMLTVSTKDGKKKTYAVKDVRVMNDKELEFILGPGPDPNNVPFSNTAEGMDIIVWYSRDGFNLFNSSKLLAPYVHSKIELGGFWRYNASEDTLEVRWSDLYYGYGPAFARYAGAALFAPFAAAWYWYYLFETQKANEGPVEIIGINSKGEEMRMFKKVKGYKFDKDKVTVELWSKGLRAKSGDMEAIEALRGFKSGIYRNVGVRALSLLAPRSLYSYSFPAFEGVMKKGMDGKLRVAFKDVDKKALQYDKRTGVVSSMDASELIEALARRRHEIFAELQLRDSSKRYIVRLVELKGVKKADDGAWISMTDVAGDQLLGLLEEKEWKEVKMGLVFQETWTHFLKGG